MMVMTVHLNTAILVADAASAVNPTSADPSSAQTLYKSPQLGKKSL